ncbi:hypothetical protein [Bacillus sp. UNC41MFS5]|nr:hypothetical protein [Bacillus sp. UNC41MFS5]
MAAIWWVTTIGLFIFLGCIGGTFFYFLRSSLNTEDSTRIDPLEINKEE